jgi:opacity protein-like surface antigen
MKRVISFGAVALLFLAAADATAQGKLSGFGAVGATTPTGDLKDIDGAKSGFGFMGGLEYKLSAPLWLRFDGMMSFNGVESTFNEDAYIWTFALSAEYWVPMGSDKLRPYVLGGVGQMLFKRNPGETGLEDTPEYMTQNGTLISAGAGLDYQIGGTSLFVEGRYNMGADSRSFIPLMFGARWGAR